VDFEVIYRTSGYSVINKYQRKTGKPNFLGKMLITLWKEYIRIYKYISNFEKNKKLWQINRTTQYHTRTSQSSVNHLLNGFTITSEWSGHLAL
jgi:hypothetical protein